MKRQHSQRRSVKLSKKRKLNEETRIEAKQERQKKVVKDRNDKNERRKGVQGGFGHASFS
jgi:hypothetical protein